MLKLTHVILACVLVLEAYALHIDSGHSKRDIYSEPKDHYGGHDYTPYKPSRRRSPSRLTAEEARAVRKLSCAAEKPEPSKYFPPPPPKPDPSKYYPEPPKKPDPSKYYPTPPQEKPETPKYYPEPPKYKPEEPKYASPKYDAPYEKTPDEEPKYSAPSYDYNPPKKDGYRH
ncbi:hypothetical protein KEM48_002934 [Puccinia striiformis f. sp. tritici PST-130]|nr:hypothetical protein KEM48_002934 [Puccinia striiformis f. sp. tritici PST-130]